MDPDATVIAPRTISVILVISNKRERPELPLNFFILRVLKVTTNNQLKVCNIDVYLKFEDGVRYYRRSLVKDRNICIVKLQPLVLLRAFRFTKVP